MQILVNGNPVPHRPLTSEEQQGWDEKMARSHQWRLDHPEHETTVRWKTHLRTKVLVLESPVEAGDDLTYTGLPEGFERLWLRFEFQDWRGEHQQAQMCLFDSEGRSKRC
jgi:hypothetical protein